MKCFKLIQISAVLILSLLAGVVRAEQLKTYEGTPDGAGDNSGVAAEGFGCVECKKRLSGLRLGDPSAFVKGAQSNGSDSSNETEGINK